MRISKKDFMKWSPKLPQEYHKWEVTAFPYNNLTAATETFEKDGDETPEELYQRAMDYVNGWRFTDTEYAVFCDGRLVVDL